MYYQVFHHAYNYHVLYCNRDYILVQECLRCTLMYWRSGIQQGLHACTHRTVFHY